MPEFESIRDENVAVKYMLRKLNEKRGISDVKINQHASIEKATEILELRKETTDELGRDSPVWEWKEIEELLFHMRVALSGIDPDERKYVDSESKGEAPETWFPDDAFQWREWVLEDPDTLEKENGDPLGYSPNGELKKSIVPPGGGATIHVYNTIPESITWELTEISQKDIKFLIGKAKVCEIDAVSSVPSLPEELSSAETGKRVLNSNLGRSEWQRRVDPKRILAIDEFIRLPNNIIANSAILYAPEGQGAISCSNDGEVTIDFAKFLRQSKEDWMDHWFNEDKTDLSADLRPMWLIDGQHRTRGLSQNEVGSEMEIPIILFTDDFSLNQSAKVFAEINTLQKPLDKLHELFMQHRFKIPTKTSKRDFRPWNVNDSETWNSRQNNLAYECAGWLTSRKNGPLYNRIKILDSNQPRYTIIKANSWVDYSRYWFRSTPYGPDCELTKTEMFQEVENYFQAFVNTCNHGDWPEEDPAQRWPSTANKKSLLQTHSASRVLLDIYQIVWEEARFRTKEKLIPINVFEDVLKPLYWVDWLDSELIHAYQGSGEAPRTSLRVWMKAAIIEGEKYPMEEVMSSSKKSLPGRGILAPPADSKINENSPWPIDEANGAVILTSKRPEHARPTSRWTVTDSEGKEWGPSGGYKAPSNTEDIALFKLEYHKWMDNSDTINIKVQWSNVNQPAGIGTKVLKKSESKK